MLLEELLEQEKREQEREGGEWAGGAAAGALGGAGPPAPPPAPPPSVPLFGAAPPPAPPPPPERAASEADHHARLLYEQWLKQYNTFAADQLRYYEQEVQKLRKIRKVSARRASVFVRFVVACCVLHYAVNFLFQVSVQGWASVLTECLCILTGFKLLFSLYLSLHSTRSDFSR